MTDLIETSTWLPRRGTSAQIAALTGEAGIDNSGRELVIDTSKATAVLMHAGMPGGVALLREDMANVQAAAGRTALGVDPAGTAAALLATHAAIADPHPDYITPAELAALLAAHFPSGDLPPVSAQVTTDLGRALLAAAGGIAGRALLSAASERQAQYLAWRDYRRGLTTPPAIDPALWLDAALYQTEAHGKPSLASFSRASSASYTDARGRLITAAAGMLRHDFNPATGQYLGWLIEEQRTNLLLRSEDFSHADWQDFNSTQNSNAATAPDGTSTANKIVETANTNSHGVYQAYSFSAATYCFSLYLKAAERSWSLLQVNDGTHNHTAYFNLASGTAGVAGGGVTALCQAVGNDWYRCSITCTTASGSGNVYFGSAAVNGNSSYAGNGSSGILAWGAQLEAGSFQTSYIGTAASQATRAADLLTVPVSAFPFNPAEGTLLVDFRPRTAGIQTEIARLYDGVADGMALYRKADNVIAWNFTAQEASQVAIVAGQRICAAARYSGTADGLVVSAGSFNAKVDSAVPTGITTLALSGAPGGGLSQLNGHIRHVAYFPRRLANTDLQDLTRL